MRFLIVGDDGASINFQVDSQTHKGETYEIHLERSTGKLFCSCPDAVTRNKIGDLTDPSAGCKHARAFHERLRLAAPGVKENL